MNSICHETHRNNEILILKSEEKMKKWVFWSFFSDSEIRVAACISSLQEINFSPFSKLKFHWISSCEISFCISAHMAQLFLICIGTANTCCDVEMCIPLFVTLILYFLSNIFCTWLITDFFFLHRRLYWFHRLVQVLIPAGILLNLRFTGWCVPPWGQPGRKISVCFRYYQISSILMNKFSSKIKEKSNNNVFQTWK